MFSRTATIKSTSAYCDKILRLKQELFTADTVLIGADIFISIVIWIYQKMFTVTF